MNPKLGCLCFRGIHNSLPSFWANLGYSQIIDHTAYSLLKDAVLTVGVNLSLCLLSLCISRVNLTIWKNVHICCDFRMFLILFYSAIQLITLHVYESIKYSPGECKKILIWISTWCNITLLFGGLWIISSLFVKCIIKVGLFCEEAEGKAPIQRRRRRSQNSVFKKVCKITGFTALRILVFFIWRNPSQSIG